MGATGIEWTDVTWNPVRGCARVSPGCENCYAERMAHRFSGAGRPYDGLTVLGKHGPRWSGRARFVAEMLDAPSRWLGPRRVFVNSMSDLFHDDVTDEQIGSVFAVMASSRRHTFQILTKRPMRMQDWILRFAREPMRNVWLGVSCEDQQRANERVPLLLKTPAAVRFVSAEPLLGPIDFNSTGKLDWVIVGGESGAGARECRTQWIDSIVRQCKVTGTPCFVKQLGSAVIQDGERRAKRDAKGGDMDEWPHGLRVRQFPGVAG